MHWSNPARLMRLYLRYLARLTFLLLWASQSEAPCSHGQDHAAESSIKFAFLYNFGKFVEWPSSKFAKADSFFVFGFVGDDPFGDDLEKSVLNKTLNGHPIHVLHATSDEEMRECHILYIGASEKKRMPALLASVRGASVLTVSDSERFCLQGGMINFRIPENKVRFEINARAAEKENLKLSSKLLSVALKKSAAESGE